MDARINRYNTTLFKFSKIFYISELGLFKSKIKVSETLQKRAKAVNWIISKKKFL